MQNPRSYRLFLFITLLQMRPLIMLQQICLLVTKWAGFSRVFPVIFHRTIAFCRHRLEFSLPLQAQPGSTMMLSYIVSRGIKSNNDKSRATISSRQLLPAGPYRPIFLDFWLCDRDNIFRRELYST